jgi:serine/threonine protein phosphatase PrpC
VKQNMKKEEWVAYGQYIGDRKEQQDRPFRRRHRNYPTSPVKCKMAHQQEHTYLQQAYTYKFKTFKEWSSGTTRASVVLDTREPGVIKLITINSGDSGAYIVFPTKKEGEVQLNSDDNKKNPEEKARLQRLGLLHKKFRRLEAKTSVDTNDGAHGIALTAAIGDMEFGIYLRRTATITIKSLPRGSQAFLYICSDGYATPGHIYLIGNELRSINNPSPKAVVENFESYRTPFIFSDNTTFWVIALDQIPNNIVEEFGILDGHGSAGEIISAWAAQTLESEDYFQKILDNVELINDKNYFLNLEKFFKGDSHFLYHEVVQLLKLIYLQNKFLADYRPELLPIISLLMLYDFPQEKQQFLDLSYLNPKIEFLHVLNKIYEKNFFDPFLAKLSQNKSESWQKEMRHIIKTYKAVYNGCDHLKVADTEKEDLFNTLGFLKEKILREFSQYFQQTLKSLKGEMGELFVRLHELLPKTPEFYHVTHIAAFRDAEYFYSLTRVKSTAISIEKSAWDYMHGQPWLFFSFTYGKPNLFKLKPNNTLQNLKYFLKPLLNEILAPLGPRLKVIFEYLQDMIMKSLKYQLGKIYQQFFSKLANECKTQDNHSNCLNFGALSAYFQNNSVQTSDIFGPLATAEIFYDAKSTSAIPNRKMADIESIIPTISSEDRRQLDQFYENLPLLTQNTVSYSKKEISQIDDYKEYNFHLNKKNLEVLYSQNPELRKETLFDVLKSLEIKPLRPLFPFIEMDKNNYLLALKGNELKKLLSHCTPKNLYGCFFAPPRMSYPYQHQNQISYSRSASSRRG